MDDLDSFDQQLIALLRRDSRRTGEQLAEEIGLSPAACLRRVQRLRKIGVIEREVAIISPKFDNRGTTIVVLLAIDRHNPKVMDEFCHRLRRQKEVERLIWVTGDDDIVVILNCPSMAEFGDFCEVHFDDTPVEGYKTLVSLREYETLEAR
jgi:Lrp/AsnC family transcriptional regulator, leucine-responsive regulatory protein